MTKEMAIEVLEKEKAYMLAHGGDSQFTALDMAIKALEQQPSDDCVSRSDVIKVLNNHWLSGSCSRRIIDEQIDKVKALPPVTPTQSWIPIVKREPTEEEKKDYLEQHVEELCYMIDSPMPNNGQEVLVSVGGYVSEDIFDEDFWNFEGCDIEDVEAWMPLPKPYEEKRGREE